MMSGVIDTLVDIEYLLKDIKYLLEESLGKEHDDEDDDEDDDDYDDDEDWED